MSEVVNIENQDAAKFLVLVKTSLGKVVPQYAKEIVAGIRAANDRAANELSIMLCQMANRSKDKLFAEIEGLKAWFDAYVTAHQKDKLHVVLHLSTAYEWKDKHGIRI
jgi:hypothetical protein